MTDIAMAARGPLSRMNIAQAKLKDAKDRLQKALDDLKAARQEYAIANDEMVALGEKGVR